MCINPLRSRESIVSRVSNINPMWTGLLFLFYVKLLMSGVSHFVFINAVLTGLSQVLTLCGLEYLSF